MAGAAAGAPAGRADPPRTGYPLPADGTAAGGWIGSRRAGHQVVYRIDPARKATASRFGPAHWLPRLAAAALGG